MTSSHPGRTSRSATAVALASLFALAGLATAGDRRPVPEVIDLPVPVAEAELRAAGFVPEREQVEGQPRGTIARQRPGGFSWAEVGSTVKIAVRVAAGGASGESAAPVPEPAARPGEQPLPSPSETDGAQVASMIPDVVGRTEEEALKLLRPWRVTLSAVEGDASTEGHVVDQDPDPGTALPAGGSVTVRVARKGAPPAGTALVPSLVGLDQESAARLLTQARLVPIANFDTSEPKNAGKVIAQEPAPGIVIAQDSNVVITVGRPATGPLSETEVPDLIRRPEAQARSILSAAGLHVIVKDRLAPSPDVDLVLDQVPAPGSRLQLGHVVTVTVGRRLLLPIQVPDTLGLDAGAAEQALVDVGFIVDKTTASSLPGSSGKVVAQEPAGGGSANLGATVRITIGRPTLPLVVSVAVPQVVGAPEAQARASLVAAGFTVAVAYVPGSAAQIGRVQSQSPAAGSTAARGSEVVIRLAGAGPSTAPEPLPSYVGGDAATAQADLVSRGLTVGVTYVNGSPDARVVSQTPVAGTPLSRGSAVTLTVTRAPTIGMTTLTSPPNGYSGPKGTRVPYAWTAVADAEDYQFEILVWKDDTWVVADNDIVRGIEKRPHHNRKGTYQWHVRARRDGGKVVGPWSEWRRLSYY